jgi:type II secretory pathway component PulF
VPAFAFLAVDPNGRRVRGIEEAATDAALARGLESRGLLVVEVEPSDGEQKSAFRRGQKQAVLEVTRAVAALLNAGLPLARALGAAAHVASGDTATATHAVRSRVERGESLAAALGAYPSLFSPLYVGLVRAGERSGDLAGAFARLSDQLERDERLRARLLSLSVYPLVLAAAGTVALVVLAFFVLPRFAELLQGTGATLPRSTALVLGIAGALKRGWPILLALALGTPLLIAWTRRTAEGRLAAARVLLELPVISSLRRQALGARVARLVGVMLGGGAPLLGALDEAVECLPDPLAQEEVARIRTRVREGVSLNRAFGEGGLFHPLLAQLVAVGEESGRLQEFLLKAAEIFEERTERGAQRLVTLLEPAMIVTFGGIVALVALSVLQAVYGVNAGVYR